MLLSQQSPTHGANQVLPSGPARQAASLAASTASCILSVQDPERLAHDPGQPPGAQPARHEAVSSVADSRSQVGVPRTVELPVHVGDVAKDLFDSPRHGEPVQTALTLDSVAEVLARVYGAQGKSVAMPWPRPRSV